MIENPTITCYDSHAGAYDAYQLAIVPGYREMLELTADAAKRYLPTNAKILDLGCGSGNASSYILAKMPSARIFLLDGSVSMITVAAEKIALSNPGAILGRNVADLAKDGWAKGLASKEFDCIVSTLVLEHLLFEPYKTAIKECYRLLKPGGWLLASEGYAEAGSDMQEWFFQEMEARRMALDPNLSDFVAHLRSEKEIHYYTAKATKAGWWKDAGFCRVNVLWQHLCLALMVGQRDP
jgi:ubiquinone/menaquinone biosynthesis C-methylase UbiE